jgi:hypothetical protein
MKAKFFIPSIRVPRAKNTRAARFLLPLLLVCLALTLAGSIAQAHGIGYYQIRGAHIDPYIVHVWVAPGVLRTGDVHIDTAVFDAVGKPALSTFVRVAFVPLETNAPALVNVAGAPATIYPYSRSATFRLETPGKYRLEVLVSDASGTSGVTSADVDVQTIPWHIKAAIIIIGLFSAASGAWLLLQTRAFWIGPHLYRHPKLRNLHFRKMGMESYLRGGASLMSETEMNVYTSRTATWSQRLNGPLHAPALWIYMMVIVAHWLEHVLQIYQIYGLGWAPSTAGGILGVIYPQLIESETLHFVYDFIQWAGIIVLLPGFFGRARTIWAIAMIFQTWHYIEHVLLMGQYLSGYYLFGAPHQISILQLWFPRAELHFVYNLLVFVPMVIAVHYYIKPKLLTLAMLNSASLEEPVRSGEQS